MRDAQCVCGRRVGGRYVIIAPLHLRPRAGPGVQKRPPLAEDLASLVAPDAPRARVFSPAGAQLLVPVLSLCEYATNCVGHVVR